MMFRGTLATAPQRHHESGFVFLAALWPLLVSAAGHVAGGAVTTATMLGIQAAMTPRSEAEQQAAINQIATTTETFLSIVRWTTKLTELWRQLDSGAVTGQRAYDARVTFERVRDLIGQPQRSDIEREAAYQLARIRWGELVAQETIAAAGGTSTPTGATPPKTPPTPKPGPQTPSTTGANAGNGTPPAVHQGSAANGGQSSVGTIALVVIGLAVAAGGLYYATRKP